MTIVVFCIVILIWLRVREVTKGCASDTHKNPDSDNNNSADCQQSIDDEAVSEAHYYDEINYDERRSKLNFKDVEVVNETDHCIIYSLRFEIQPSRVFQATDHASSYAL